MKRTLFGGKSANRVLAYAFTPAQPPDTVRLWKAGDNPTDYGTHVWNERSIECVYTAYLGAGNRLAIDIEHGMAHAADGEVVESAGYCELELVNGEPWLRFHWSAIGAMQIETRQRLYLSPEYGVDPDTGEIVSLTRVSLVAAPGTHHAVILAAAKKEEDTMNPQDIIDAIRNALNGEGDPETKIATAQAVLDGLSVAAGDGTTDDTPDNPTDENGDPPPVADDIAAAGGGVAPNLAAADDDKSGNPVTAAKPIAAAAPKAKPADVAAQTAALVKKTVDNASRDFILATQGAHLPEALRAACKLLPLENVKKIIASHAATASPRNAKPVQGGGDSAPKSAIETIRAAAPTSSLAKMAIEMGVKGIGSAAPHRDERGGLVTPMRTPSQIRAAKAAAQTPKGT